jgi:hypothetical protein
MLVRIEGMKITLGAPQMKKNKHSSGMEAAIVRDWLAIKLVKNRANKVDKQEAMRV